MTYNCPFHNQELVLREGVSKKTGKEYSFYGCSVKDNGQFCAHTVPNAEFAPRTQDSSQTGQSTPNRNTEVLEGILKELVTIRETVCRMAPPIINKTSENDQGLPF